MSSDADKRQYTRLKCVFPIEFAIVRLQGDLPGIDWQQASTCNVSSHGVCFQTKSLNESTIKYLKNQNIYLEVRLKIPVNQPFIRAVADVVWYEVQNDTIIVGLKFRSIIKSELNRIIRHAIWFTYSSKAVIVLCVVLFLAILAWGYGSYKTNTPKPTPPIYEVK